jgi:hypothetical protein
MLLEVPADHIGDHQNCDHSIDSQGYAHGLRPGAF